MLARTLSVCLLVAAVGCGQAPSSPPSQPGSTTTNAAADSSPEAAPAAPTAATDATQIPALLAELTQAVRKYGAEKQRVPKSLDELVAGGYLDQVPQAPPGKRFEIDKRLQVQLVDD